MHRLASFLKGAGLGAVLMYLFDPARGNRRRSLIRDQFRHITKKTGKRADTTLRDVRNRVYGTLAEVRGFVSPDHASDDVVVSRVRSKLGHYVTHAAAIEVEAHDGIITLHGPILAHEVGDLAYVLTSIRGVRGLRNELEIHTSRGNVSALQGNGQRNLRPGSILQSDWSPETRVAAGTLGSLVMVKCLARRSPAAMLTGAAGFGLMLRALTNLEMKRLLGIRTQRGNQVEIDATQACSESEDRPFYESANEDDSSEQPAGSTAPHLPR